MRACLFKRHGRWHAKVKLDTWTTEKRLSLGTTDRRAANIELEKRLRDFEAVDQGRLAPPRVRHAAQQSLPELCAAFLASIEPSTSLGTGKKYAAAFRSVSREMGWTRLADVTEANVREWQSGSDLRAKTCNDYLAAWYRFCRWLHRQRMVPENACQFIDPVDVTKTEREYRRALTEAEVERLLQVAPWPRALIYRLILETALRRLELRRLRVCDFSLRPSSYSRPGGGAEPALADRPRSVDAGGSITRPTPDGPSVRVPASIAKNRKESVQALNEQTAADLAAFFPADAAPFYQPFRTCIPRIATFKRDLARAGIPFVDAEGRRADLHSLRKTPGATMLYRGENPVTVMQFMRHSDMRLTMKIYRDARLFDAPVAAAAAALPWQRKQAVEQREFA